MRLVARVRADHSGGDRSVALARSGLPFARRGLSGLRRDGERERDHERERDRPRSL